MSRLFTLRQAEELLPEVEQAMREAISLREQCQAAEGQFQAAVQRIVVLGGSLVNPVRLQALRSERDSGIARLKQVLAKIASLGCLIKDLDTGLIDFPTLYHGTEVYLCWRLGESGISFWHGVDEGFRGRKSIDQDFLQNHEGGMGTPG